MLIFVYGTLKRGGSNHHYMNGQRFVTEATTLPRYRLYDLGGYPGMVLDLDKGLGIQGEIWEVDAAGLTALDELEDVDGGEYVRENVPLLPPFDQTRAEGYRYLRPVTGCPPLGTVW